MQPDLHVDGRSTTGAPGRPPQDTAWVDPSYADPQVDHAARNVFDYNYDGAGNWPFNTAYAAPRPRVFVTRLRSLTEAEQFIKAGIPLVVSVSFKKEELDGAGYGTNGHLMVIVGFDEDGNVVVNDPASHLIKSNEGPDDVRPRAVREHLDPALRRHRLRHPSGRPRSPGPHRRTQLVSRFGGRAASEVSCFGG